MELTNKMRRFLDGCVSRDLITSVYRFQREFDLSEKDCNRLVRQWQDEPSGFYAEETQ